MYPPDDLLPQSALIKIPRQPRSIGMVHSILDAGMAVIRDTGLAGMTTNRVADRAGVSIGSLYQYFANRESILAGIIERSQLDIIQRMRQLHVAQLNYPLEQMLQTNMLFLLRYHEPNMTVFRRVIREAPLLADNSVLRIMESTLMDMFRDYLLNNSHRYRLRNGHAGLYVAVNTIIFMYLKWLVQPHPAVSEAHFIDALTTQVLSCLDITAPG